MRTFALLAGFCLIALLLIPGCSSNKFDKTKANGLASAYFKNATAHYSLLFDQTNQTTPAVSEGELTHSMINATDSLKAYCDYMRENGPEQPSELDEKGTINASRGCDAYLAEWQECEPAFIRLGLKIREVRSKNATKPSKECTDLQAALDSYNTVCGGIAARYPEVYPTWQPWQLKECG